MGRPAAGLRDRRRAWQLGRRVWLVVLLVAYHMFTARTAVAGPASNDDYKKAVFDDLSRGPNG